MKTLTLMLTKHTRAYEPRNTRGRIIKLYEIHALFTAATVTQLKNQQLGRNTRKLAKFTFQALD